ncbi:hypothetical protein LTR55_012219, partial [Exophiala xenobiotica]
SSTYSATAFHGKIAADGRSRPSVVWLTFTQRDTSTVTSLFRTSSSTNKGMPRLFAPELIDHPTSLYIGEKSDLFQLGIILWALAMEDDEPERHRPSLKLYFAEEIPDWY